jgi:nucleoporin SEH1
VKPGEELDGDGESEEEGKWTASIVADFDQHKWAFCLCCLYIGVDYFASFCFTFRSTVGRVEWNITGWVYVSVVIMMFKLLIIYLRTILSSAGNDGRIRLWKATSGNVWRPAGSIGVEQAEENEQQDNKDVEMDA